MLSNTVSQPRLTCASANEVVSNTGLRRHITLWPTGCSFQPVICSISIKHSRESLDPRQDTDTLGWKVRTRWSLSRMREGGRGWQQREATKDPYGECGSLHWHSSCLCRTLEYFTCCLCASHHKNLWSLKIWRKNTLALCGPVKELTQILLESATFKIWHT